MPKKKTTIHLCAECKTEFDMTDSDWIKVSQKYYETDCYKNKLLHKGLSEEVVNEKIRLIKYELDLIQKEKEQKELEKLKKKVQNTKNKIKDDEFKKQLIQWIQCEYEITKLDSLFFIKLANINNGTFKGLSEGISNEDLLYMFKTKKSELDKIANDKERKGRGFQDNKSRLNFDLAVIVNKYDSYKQWKEKQKLIEAEQIRKENDTNKPKVDLGKISKNNNVNNKETELDLSDLIEDLY